MGIEGGNRNETGKEISVEADLLSSFVVIFFPTIIVNYANLLPNLMSQ